MHKNNLVIRLQKAGNKTAPFYNIIVTFNSRSAKANSLAKIGYYNPFNYKSLKNINQLVIFKDLNSCIQA